MSEICEVVKPHDALQRMLNRAHLRPPSVEGFLFGDPEIMRLCEDSQEGAAAELYFGSGENMVYSAIY
jgi:hypothetical protein